MASVRASELGLNFDHWCFACGHTNPNGLRLELSFARDRAEARFTGKREHQGYDDMLHGGIVAALLDEVMGWAIFHQGIWAVTTRLELRLRRRVPIGEEVHVTGKVARDRGRALEMRGEVRRVSDGELLASAEATYVRMDETQRKALIEKYGDPAPALERIAALGRGRE
jgi:acyl-coenzyme A thioesterase PaaI-like protein